MQSTPHKVIFWLYHLRQTHGAFIKKQLGLYYKRLNIWLLLLKGLYQVQTIVSTVCKCMYSVRMLLSVSLCVCVCVCVLCCMCHALIAHIEASLPKLLSDKCGAAHFPSHANCMQSARLFIVYVFPHFPVGRWWLALMVHQVLYPAKSKVAEFM